MSRYPRLALLGLALLVGAVPPASAAENIDCALALIDQPVSEDVFSTYRAGGNVGEPLMKHAGDKLRGCVRDNGWTPTATESAMRVMFGEMLLQGQLRELDALGLPRAAVEASIDSFLAGLSPEDMRLFADGDLDDRHGQALVEKLLADGAVQEAQLSEKTGFLLGELAASRANIIIFRAEFARQ